MQVLIPVPQELLTQQQEQIYFVFQDLQNVIGVYAETVATIKLFEHNPKHPYIKIAHNRLVLQLNLSNAILYDQTIDAQKNELLSKNLASLKSKARAFFEEIIMQIEPPNEFMQEMAHHYITINLENQHEVRQLNQEKVESTFNLDQKLLDRLFSAMQKVDEDLLRIKQGEKMQIPDQGIIMDKAVARYFYAQEQLTKNFPEESKIIQGRNTFQ